MSDSEQSNLQAAGTQPESTAEVAERTTPKQPATEQQLKKTEEKIDERMSAFERSTIRLTRVAVGVAILTFVCVVFQGYEMYTGGQDTGTLAKQAVTQATQTTNLATATDKMKDSAEKSAQASRDFADTAGDIDASIDVAVNKLDSQARATQGAARAAKSAAETADKALHISERAYVIAATPSMNADSSVVTLPILNTGHIPSGEVKAVIHEATLVITPGSPTNSSVETHWKNYTLESVPTTGETLSFNIATPNVDVSELKSGHQQVLIVGIISYNDGFRDDPDQQWSFCFGDTQTPQNKDLGWVVCDSSLYLSQAIAADHYPQNEYK